MKEQPKFDQDILGDDIIPEDERPVESTSTPKQVKDTYYYDLFNLDPSVDSAMIKRRYYIIARKFSPDRCGANAKAQEQFQEIGRAYCVLMNDDLRARYDKVGREGLGTYCWLCYMCLCEIIERVIFVRFYHVGFLIHSSLLSLPCCFHQVYALAACQFLGSVESGIGMPSISRWAKKQSETMKFDTQRLSTNVKHVAGDMERISFNQQVGSVIDKTEGDEDLELVGKQILKNALQNKVVRMLWQQTVVDITNTIHEAAQMVLHDQNVTAEIRKKRGQGLQTLGEIFQTAKKRDIPIIEQQEMEEIAFNAMLDTVWRQESAARAVEHHVSE
jgi:hypothetical protein